jgi:hypothetical protein
MSSARPTEPAPHERRSRRAATAAAPVARHRRALGAMRRSEWPLYLAVVIVTTVVTVFALDLWKMQWNIPLVYEGDAVTIAAQFKTDFETGWYEIQPLLGAPFQQVFHDYKSADNAHHLFAVAAGLFTSQFGVAMNLYYILGYVLAALTAAWFFRLVGATRLISIALSVLYAIAPYHLFRSEHHLWLSAYYPIPLAMGVVYLIAIGRPIWGRNERIDNRILSWLTGSAAFTSFALALVASASSYYGFWIVLFIACAGLVQLVQGRDWRRFVGAVVAGVWTVVVMVINMAPDILYAAANGSAAAVARFPAEAETNSLKFIQLVLPQSGHRFQVLRDLRTFYDSNYPFSFESPSLGVVAAVGFVSGLAIVVYAAVAFGARREAPSPLLRTLGVLGALTLVAFLLSTVGGLSSIASFFTSDLRGWNRMVILLALLGLAVLALLLDALRAHLTRKSTSALVRRGLALAVAVAMLAVGYVDQVTPTRVPDYAGTKATFDQDEQMVDDIESLVASDAMILQVPYRLYPESSSTKGVSDTDQLRPFLHSDTLRWSGGGVKGRPASLWSMVAEEQLSTPAYVYAAAAADFGGVLFDRKPYDEGVADEVEAELIATLGDPEFRTPDGRYLFFTMDAARSVLDARVAGEAVDAIGADVTHPVLLSFAPDYVNGFSVLDSLKDYEPEFTVVNPRDEDVTVDVAFDIAYREGEATVEVDLPGGGVETFTVDPGYGKVRFSMTAPPGTTTLAVRVVDGPQPVRGTVGDGGPFSVAHIEVTDGRLVGALQAVEGLQVLRPENGSGDR